ncbi:MAG: tetratricopeptide repeat protein, partial [Chloroflexi bacterium]
EKAVDLLSQSLALQRQFGGPKEIGLAINSVAVVLQAQGKLSEAIDMYHEGLTIQRETGDQIGLAQTLQNLGAAAIDQGDYAYAQQVSIESLALFRQLQLKWGIAYVSINLALALLRQGSLTQARHHIMEGVRLCREIESQDSVAECLEVLAGIEQGVGNAPLAVQLLAKADLLRTEVGAPRQAGSEADYQQLTAVLREQMSFDMFTTYQQAGQTQPLENLIKDQV